MQRLRVEQREPPGDADLVVVGAERCLAVVLHHLREDELGELAAVAKQHVLDIGVGVEIGPHPRHHLASERVEQIGMGIVIDLVALNQVADEVVLRAAPRADRRSLWRDKGAPRCEGSG